MPSCLAISFTCASIAAAWLWSFPGQPPPVNTSKAQLATVVITGGTGGLGLATVKLLAQRGDSVFTCGRNPSRVDDLNKISGVHAQVVDLSQPEQVQRWADSVAERLKGTKIDALVNNAGLLRIGDPAAAITMQAYDAVMNVNVRGLVATTAAFWPFLRRGGAAQEAAGSVVINVGSTTETPKLAQAFHSIYSVSKCAVRAYSTGLRQEGRLAGVSVIHLKTGAFESELHSSFDAAESTLSSYAKAAPDLAAYAKQLQVRVKENLQMVSPKPAAEFAEAVYSIVHSDRLADPWSGEYWLNVSWLEFLVEFLPQPLLDFFILHGLRQDGSKSGGSKSGGDSIRDEV